MSEEVGAAATLVFVSHDPQGGLDDNQHGIPLGSAPQQDMSNVEQQQQQQQASPPEGVSQDHSNQAMALGLNAENHNLQGPVYNPNAQAVTTFSQHHVQLALALGYDAMDINYVQTVIAVSQNNSQPAQALGSDVMDIDTAHPTATMDSRGRKRSRSLTPEAAGSNKQKKRRSYSLVILPCTYDAEGRATYPGPKTYVDKVNDLRHGRYTLLEGQLPPTTGLQMYKPRRRRRGPRR